MSRRYTGLTEGQPPLRAVKMIGTKSDDYFGYDTNRNMISRNGGTGTITFAYDANGQRVKTVRPDGDAVYTPFPQYEEELLGAVSIKRRTYTPPAPGSSPIAAKACQAAVSSRDIPFTASTGLPHNST